MSYHIIDPPTAGRKGKAAQCFFATDKVDQVAADIQTLADLLMGMLEETAA
jgi:hypothetical protein